MRILVSGAGSIGSRHARNLKTLGVDLVITDPDENRMNALAQEIGAIAFESLEEALKEKPDAVFVCSPSSLHIQQAKLAVESGANVFIEKPLSHSLTGVDDLISLAKAKRVKAFVGCNMRFHHGPSIVKKLIDEGRIGKIIGAEVYTGSYLPDWRPKQDYKQSYSADPFSGGAILDCIHEIDLALWYLGSAEIKNSEIESAASIDLPEVDGSADLILQHSSGAVSKVHLSFIEKEYKRFCIIKGESGTIKWDINSKKVELIGSDSVEVYDEPDGYDMNQMYLEEAKHFLDAIANSAVLSGTLEEAREALEIAIYAKKEVNLSVARH
ncbi:Gfo/Idh/MocA family oxidoreductase [Patescibacteria group bacterium]|nr:Gfo/Idh/MocA family oxidoreductase [Patescibacteria group bacterium]